MARAGSGKLGLHRGGVGGPALGRDGDHCAARAVDVERAAVGLAHQEQPDGPVEPDVRRVVAGLDDRPYLKARRGEPEGGGNVPRGGPLLRDVEVEQAVGGDARGRHVGREGYLGEGCEYGDEFARHPRRPPWRAGDGQAGDVDRRAGPVAGAGRVERADKAVPLDRNDGRVPGRREHARRRARPHGDLAGWERARDAARRAHEIR